MAEAPVEKYLCDQVKAAGGVCLKLAMIGKRNFPDRTVLLPGGIIFFVECKDISKDLRKTQRWFIERILQPLGFTVYVCKTKKQVDKILNAHIVRQ